MKTITNHITYKLRLIIALLTLASSSQVFAVYNICSVGNPGVGYTTIFVTHTWSSYDVSTPAHRVVARSELASPYGVLTSTVTGGSGGSLQHVYVHPLNGNRSVWGNTTGYWEDLPHTMSDCWISYNIQNPATVQVISASIPNDTIQVSVSYPWTISGTLTVWANGPTGSHVIASGTKSNGTHTYTFNRASLPQQEFATIEASWQVNGGIYNGSRSYRFKNLGVYHHSQYNAPSEISCAGTPTMSATITTSSCGTTGTTLRTVFRNEVNENGHGHSIGHGIVGIEWACTSVPGSAPGQTSNIVFRGNKSYVEGSAGQEVNTSTVAYKQGHPDIQLHHSVYIVGVGTKAVKDYCPGCTNSQLDNFSSATSCAQNSVPSLGNYQTILLY